MAPVSGKVTYRGKPLPFGQIVMVHSTGPMAAGEIGPDGSYSIEAAVGENRVMITCNDPKVARTPFDPPSKLIPQRYVDYMSSGLTLNVTDGNNTKDWNLVD